MLFIWTDKLESSLSTCLILTYTEYKSTAGSTPRDKPLLVVHLAVELALLLEHLGVLQPDAAVTAGEVALVPVVVTRLDKSWRTTSVNDDYLHCPADDVLLALAADHDLLVGVDHLLGVLPAHSLLHSAQHGHNCHDTTLG